MKTAFVCFFPVVPTNMGSAEVVRSLFLCWPGKKKLFQISHLHSENKSNLKSLRIIKEKPLFKIIMIPFLIYSVFKFLKNSENKLVIIEGPSWIGYSFLTLLIIKIFNSKIKIIYHSHSIEYEVRKMATSKIIVILTKILEEFVFKYADIATSVSELEKKKIKKLYKVNTTNLNNGISKKIIKFSKKKTLNFDYIIYCGSYKYLPNKLAIDYLIKNIMPSLVKYYPKIKLVLTGGGYPNNDDFLINLGIVKKKYLLNLIYNSKAMVVPLDKGTGTRIKIIESLSIGSVVLSTLKGAEGIEFCNKKNSNLIIEKKNNFIKKLKKIIKSDYEAKVSSIFKKKYLMENIVNKFLKQQNVQKLIKKN
jgi:hypothetical protein